MPEGLAGLFLIIPLGLCLGSFATAIIARIPSGKSWIASSAKLERSACPHCGHTLGVLDLVPLLSWLCLHGCCRYCHHPIGIRYPLIEFCTLFCCLLVYAGWGFSASGMILLAAVPFIISMLVIDLEHLILPNQLQVILFVLGLIYVFFQSQAEIFSGLKLTDFGHSLLSSVLYGGLAYGLAWGGRLAFRREALGLGDVKFFAVAGLWLGFTALPAFMLLAGVMGVALGLMWKIYAKKDVFPFGPALLASFLLLLLLRGPLFSSVLSPFLRAFPGLS